MHYRSTLTDPMPPRTKGLIKRTPASPASTLTLLLVAVSYIYCEPRCKLANVKVLSCPEVDPEFPVTGFLELAHT